MLKCSVLLKQMQCGTKPGLLLKKNPMSKRPFLEFDKNIECVLESMKKVFPENALSIRSAVKDCLAPKGNLLLEIQFAREYLRVLYPLKRGWHQTCFLKYNLAKKEIDVQDIEEHKQ